MSADEHRREDEESIPLSDRRGRNAVRPESQPGEFADDMRVNRFDPPPPPPTKDDKKQ